MANGSLEANSLGLIADSNSWVATSRTDETRRRMAHKTRLRMDRIGVGRCPKIFSESRTLGLFPQQIRLAGLKNIVVGESPPSLAAGVEIDSQRRPSAVRKRSLKRPPPFKMTRLRRKMRSTLRFASSTSSQWRSAPRWPTPSSCGPTCPPRPASQLKVLHKVSKIRALAALSGRDLRKAGCRRKNARSGS